MSQQGLLQITRPYSSLCSPHLSSTYGTFYIRPLLQTSFRPISLPWKLLIGYLMIDEVYAPAWNRLKKGDITPDELKWYFVGGGLNLATVWWTTTVIGTWLGENLPESTTDTLGFTLPLIFTAIVVPLLVSRSTLLSALIAFALGIICAPMPNNLGLIVAAVAGISIGVLTESPAKSDLLVNEAVSPDSNHEGASTT